MKPLERGRPPVWRLVIYALIAMSIPGYFFYPHIHDSSYGWLLYVITLLIPAGMIGFFAFIPWIGTKQFAAPKFLPKSDNLVRYILFLLGIVLAVVAAIAIFTGQVVAVGKTHNRDFDAVHQPFGFWFTVGIYVALSAYFFHGAFKNGK
jgi:hypothetical protein